MFNVDDEKIKQFESDLKTFAKKSFPRATRNTLNTSAFHAQKVARKIVNNKMITRNRFTERSIQVIQTRTLNINAQQSFVGSTEDYMERQEFGGTITSKGKHGVPLATTVASGEGKGSRPRLRLPTRASKLRNIRLDNRGGTFKSKKQEFFYKLKQASESGHKHVFLETRRKKAIYRVKVSGRKFDIKMLFDLSHRTVTTPRNPWLSPTIKSTERVMPRIHLKSLEFQMKFHGLFK